MGNQDSETRTHSRGPAPATLRERLVRACDRHTDARVRKATGLSGEAFYRAKAGSDVNYGTCLAIERALDLLESTQA